MFKKGKKLLSFLLCFAMIFSSLPMGAFAETAPAAKSVLSILKQGDDGGFSEMKAEEIQLLAPGSKFYLGVKAENWKSIEKLAKDGMDGGMVSLSLAINYRDDLLDVESDLRKDPDATKKQFSRKIVERLGEISSDTYANLGDGYGFTSSSFPNRAVKPGDTVLKDEQTKDKWKQIYIVSAYEDPSNMKQAWHGDGDHYLFVLQMNVKPGATLPTDGSAIICWTDTSSTDVLSMGANKADGSAKNVQYTRNAANTTMEITDYIDFQVGNTVNLAPEAYAITYKANGGTFGDEKVEVVRTLPKSYSSLTAAGLSVLDAPAAPEKYGFGGWYVNGDWSQYNPGDALPEGAEAFTAETTISGDTTVYAYWKAGHTVTFELNGGTWGDKTEAQQAFGLADAAVDVSKLPAGNPTKTVGENSYDFAGWTSNADGSGDNYADVNAVVEALGQANAESATVYAKWEVPASVAAENRIDVILDPNYGTFAGLSAKETKKVTILVGDTLSSVYPTDDTVTREGYKLYKETETVKALNTVQNADGGAYVQTDTVINKTNVPTLVEPTTEAAGSVTLYTQWMPDPEVADNTVELTFDASNADGNGAFDEAGTTTKTITVVKNAVIGKGNLPTEPAKAPTKEDGEALGFAGWTTVEKANIDDSIMPIDFDTYAAPAENTTYNAIWVDSFDVTYHAGAGTFTGGSDEKTYVQVKLSVGDELTLGDVTLTPPENYTFKEWNTRANGLGTKIDLAKDTASASVKNIYAVYEMNSDVPEENQVVVSFNSNGADTAAAPASITLVKGSALNTLGMPNDPVKKGYTFDGWYDALLDGTKYTGTEAINEALTLYAHWTVNAEDADVDESKTKTVKFFANDGASTEPIATVEVANLKSTGKNILSLGDFPSVARTGFKAVRWENGADSASSTIWVKPDANGWGIDTNTAAADSKVDYDDFSNIDVTELTGDELNFYMVWTMEASPKVTLKMNDVAGPWNVTYKAADYASDFAVAAIVSATDGTTDYSSHLNATVNFTKEVPESTDDGPAAAPAPTTAVTNAGTYTVGVTLTDKDTEAAHPIVFGSNIEYEGDNALVIAPYELNVNLTGDQFFRQTDLSDFTLAKVTWPTLAVDETSMSDAIKTDYTNAGFAVEKFKVNGTAMAAIQDTDAAEHTNYAVHPVLNGDGKDNYTIVAYNQTADNKDIKVYTKTDFEPELDDDLYAKFSITKAEYIQNVTITETTGGDDPTTTNKTLYSDNELTTEKKFDADADNNEYWTEVGVDTTIKITIDGEVGDEAVKAGDETVIAPKTDKDGNKYYEIDLKDTVNGSFDKITIEVGGKTHTIHIRQLINPTITLKAGNSPFGLIERMADKGWDAAKIQSAKEAFIANDSYGDELVPEGGVAGLIYSSRAWFGQGLDDKETIGENLDQNVTVQFVYNQKDFVDAGFVVADSRGQAVADENVIRKINVKTMQNPGLEFIADNLVKESLIEFKVSADDKTMNFADNGARFVRPGVYEMKYFINDPAMGENYEVGSRKIVVLWTTGDVNLSAAVDQGDVDSITFVNSEDLKLYENGVAKDAQYVHTYRIVELNASGAVDNGDVDTLKFINAEELESIEFYANIGA